MAGYGRLADRPYRAEADAGVVLRDPDDRTCQRQTDDAAPEQIKAGDLLACCRTDDAVAAEHVLCRKPQSADGENARGNDAAIERTHDRVIGAEFDEQRPDDRRHDTGCTNGERIHHHRTEIVLIREEDAGENHGGDNRDGVGLEQVGGHTGTVADVIADVVGNRCGVAWIVLGNAGLDLADEVGADVRTLRKDAASETGKDRNE